MYTEAHNSVDTQLKIASPKYQQVFCDCVHTGHLKPCDIALTSPQLTEQERKAPAEVGVCGPALSVGSPGLSEPHAHLSSGSLPSQHHRGPLQVCGELPRGSAAGNLKISFSSLFRQSYF